MRFHMHYFGRGDSQKESDSSLPEAGESSPELQFLPAETLHFRHEGSRLQMRKQGEEDWQGVSVVRLFPFSESEGWISVLDEKGKEIGILRELRGLSLEDRASVREELARRYLVPEIRRILSCRQRFDLVEWTVQTDRGKATFLTRNFRQQVNEPLPRRLTFTDVEGNRYDVPDLAALDPQSRRWLEMRM